MAAYQSKPPLAGDNISTPIAPQQMKTTEVIAVHQPSPVDPEKTPVKDSTVSAVGAEQAPSQPTEQEEKDKDKDKDEVLNEEQVRVLFSGAAHFSVSMKDGRPTPIATYPWNRESPAKDAFDSVPLTQPAFLAATLHQHASKVLQLPDEQNTYQGYRSDVVEIPSMLSAQGIEAGSVGFRHFLELPNADSLVTNLADSQSSKDFLQASRNKELFQSTPEKLGIRAVDIGHIYDRLIEFQDLYETFHDSPVPITILNNQSAGDLYANLFSKFLTPPGYDGIADDPSGLQIQIITLVKTLRLKGFWYDFSLVEWRIRLGQILWSDPEPPPSHEPHPLWTEREVLLLQITLACELLLRIDAVTVASERGDDRQCGVSLQDVEGILQNRTRKLDWDLVLARRFLDNILVATNSDSNVQVPAPKSRLLAMLGGEEDLEAPKLELVLLPRHQARQLSGLLNFAQTLHWPNTESLLQDFTKKLGVRDSTHQLEPLPFPDNMLHDPISPASISIYGTPLHTPHPANHLLDGYFGHVGKPTLKRNNSQSLCIPLSPILSPIADQPHSAPSNIGGWLSRSYLTGLILPGESVSHFLISTLLENDQAAIASLGDSANLYGGFTYAGRAWWSKNSIVGRVFACVEGSVECMGWISFPKPPEADIDGWHSIHSEQLPMRNRMADTKSDVVATDSAIVPNWASIKPEDFVLPNDSESVPAVSKTFAQWELMPLNPDLIDNDVVSGPPTESDIHVPTLTFTSQDQISSYTLSLSFDVSFITSWPCTPPTSTQTPSLPHILRRSLTGMSRASSRRSGSTARLSRRNSHGFEPLLSHPPDSTDIAPKRMYSGDDTDGTIVTRQPMNAHPLHVSYRYKVIPVVDVLDSDFVAPFDQHGYKPEDEKETAVGNDTQMVLVLDTRSSTDLQLLARAWCAEKGFHAIIGRVGRTCLACCIREARGLGVNVVIRV
jgi:hypothetical protein